MWRNGGLAGSYAYDETKAQTKGAVKRVARPWRTSSRAPTLVDHHHKRGKLDDRRLWAVRSSDRLFTKPKTYEDFKLRCVILIDASGSMSGGRARQAAKAAVALSEAMEAVGADYEVVDFNPMAPSVDTLKGNLHQCARRQRCARKPSSVKSPRPSLARRTPMATRQVGHEPPSRSAQPTLAAVFISATAPRVALRPMAWKQRPPAPSWLTLKDDCILFSVDIAGMDTAADGMRAGGHAKVSDISTLATDILVPLKTALKKALKKKMKVVANEATHPHSLGGGPRASCTQTDLYPITTVKAGLARGFTTVDYARR